MNPFSYYEHDSWLHRRNPTAKLAAHLLLALAMTLVFDPVTPLAFFAVAVVAGAALGRVPPLPLLKAMLPFWLLGVSLILSNALFANQPENATVLWTWGPFIATAEGAAIGLSLAERSVAIAAFSVLLMMTTDPTDLVRSLVQQARMPAQFAYPALAAYRFLPLLQTEYETVRLAQRLRGVGRDPSPAEWLREQRRLLLPLLAAAIRKSERVALAMDARGFSGRQPRTHYRQLRFGRADTVLLGATLALILTILWTSAALGILRLWTGALGI